MEKLTSDQKLRRAHYEQLLAYANDMDWPGGGTKWYYAPQKQFEKRHEEIKEWLRQQISR